MKVIFTVLLISSAALLSPSFSTAQDIVRMREVVEMAVKKGQFTGSVLVMQGDQVLIDKGYGQANLEWKQASTPQTKYRIGSVTKQFTAVAVLLLEERGKLKLTDYVKQYVDDIPAAWDAITIENLLNHTAGLHNFTDLAAYQKIKILDMQPLDTLKIMRDLPLDFPVGTEYRYSNSGYVLLGQIIEKVGGVSYAQFLQTNIFKPLGMANSSVDSALTILPLRAAGYKYIQTDEKTQPKIVNADPINMSVPHAAGAIISTTHDLQRWQKALYGGKLLSAASLKKMLTPNKSGYGLGVQVAELHAADGSSEKQGTTMTRRKMAHGGGIDGFAAWLQYYEASRLHVVVLGNIEQAISPQLGVRLAAMAGEAPPFNTTPFYLRGSMNNWGITDRMVSISPKLWAVDIALAPGEHEFKFGSEDFNQIDFGGRYDETAVRIDSTQTLHFIGSNLKINVPQSTRYRFSLDVRDAYGPKLSVIKIIK